MYRTCWQTSFNRFNTVRRSKRLIFVLLHQVRSCGVHFDYIFIILHIQVYLKSITWIKAVAVSSYIETVGRFWCYQNWRSRFYHSSNVIIAYDIKTYSHVLAHLHGHRRIKLRGHWVHIAYNTSHHVLLCNSHEIFMWISLCRDLIIY